MMLVPYTAERLLDLHSLISSADRVDKANLGISLESLQHLQDVTDAADVCLAIQSGELIGYARLEWDRAETTRVGCLGIVHPSHRRLGVGTALLAWGVERARNCLAGRPFTFYVPVRHSVQGLEQLVTSLQMQPARYFYVLRYERLPELPPEPQGLPGIQIRSYVGPGDGVAYLAAFHRVFGARSAEGAAQLMDFAPELCLLAFAQNNLVGFCRCAVSPAESEVEYLGVLPEHRRQGLASALLSSAVRMLAERGHQNIHLAVNVQNEQALSLYHRMDFAPWRRSTTYERQY